MQYFSIHSYAIVSFVGAAVTMGFALYHLVYYLVIRSDRLVLNFFGFLMSLFLYLFGYSMYTSSNQVYWVLFWTRICYAGGATTIFTNYIVAREIVGWKSPFLDWVYRAVSLFYIFIIFWPWEGLFLTTLYTGEITSTVVKGPFFVPFLLGIFISCGAILVRLIGKTVTNKDKRRMITPLSVGFAYWFLETMFNGVFAAILHRSPGVLSFGPIVMTLCIAIYNAKIAEERSEELIRVRKKNAEIRRDLIFDKLSGLFTRGYFLRKVEERIAYHGRHQARDVLFFIDIDYFKSVNDELGHDVGDNLIREVGSVLKVHSRKTDVCGRFGGDEFLILLVDCPENYAGKIAMDIMADFKERLPALFGSWAGAGKVSMSIGILPSEYWEGDSAECIRRADHAMYVSKRSGRGRISHYSPEMEMVGASSAEFDRHSGER